MIHDDSSIPKVAQVNYCQVLQKLKDQIKHQRSLPAMAPVHLVIEMNIPDPINIMNSMLPLVPLVDYGSQLDSSKMLLSRDRPVDLGDVPCRSLWQLWGWGL